MQREEEGGNESNPKDKGKKTAAREGEQRGKNKTSLDKPYLSV